jgi:hypothetical protein
MPIEIKELHIRVNVNDENCNTKSKQNQSQQQTASGDMNRQSDEYAEKVLDILKRRKLR